ncbi:GrpB family protein [Nocardia sp. FBN12]|uniref:GrpB family protein n=1 Tax=Nocardia sp. FBN12 TaxID=3419766 RepID=UPI003D082A41
MSNDDLAEHDWNVSGDHLRIVDYDPAWPRMAADAISELRTLWPNLLAEVEHIGSTAASGLAAKPVIDLMAAAVELAEVERREGQLSLLGYRRHLNGISDRLIYVRIRDNIRTHILHVVDLASWPHRNQRLLRDYLRAHPHEAERYAQLKRQIVDAGTPARDYARAKTELIQELTDRARARLGLAPVPVWEK